MAALAPLLSAASARTREACCEACGAFSGMSDGLPPGTVGTRDLSASHGCGWGARRGLWIEDDLLQDVTRRCRWNRRRLRTGRHR